MAHRSKNGPDLKTRRRLARAAGIGDVWRSHRTGHHVTIIGRLEDWLTVERRGGRRSELHTMTLAADYRPVFRLPTGQAQDDTADVLRRWYLIYATTGKIPMGSSIAVRFGSDTVTVVPESDPETATAVMDAFGRLFLALDAALTPDT